MTPTEFKKDQKVTFKVYYIGSTFLRYEGKVIKDKGSYLVVQYKGLNESIITSHVDKTLII